MRDTVKRCPDAELEASLRDYAEGRYKRGSLDDLLRDLKSDEES